MNIRQTIDETETNLKQQIEYERMVLFYKYIVLFQMCEALKEERKVFKNRTLSRERATSIGETRKWFRKDNEVLREYCYLGRININKLFEEYERRREQKIVDNYLKPKFLARYKKLLTIKI